MKSSCKHFFGVTKLSISIRNICANRRHLVLIDVGAWAPKYNHCKHVMHQTVKYDLLLKGIAKQHITRL